MIDEHWSEWAQSKDARAHYVLRGQPEDFWHRFRVKHTERWIHRKKNFCFIVWTPANGALVIPAQWFVRNIGNKAIPDRIAGWVGGKKGAGWSFGVASTDEERLTIPDKIMHKFVFPTPIAARELLRDQGELQVSYSPRVPTPDLSKELIGAARRAQESALYNLSQKIPAQQRVREIKFALRRLYNEARKSEGPPNASKVEHGPIGRLLKAWAEYRCQVRGCNVRNFKTKEGVPYAEAHYLDELASPSLSLPENVIVLCAHHHRIFHHALVNVSRRGEDSFTLDASGAAIEVRRFRFADRGRDVAHRPEPPLASYDS